MLRPLHDYVVLEKIKEEEKDEEVKFKRKKIRPVILLLFLIMLIIPFKLVSKPWNYLVAIIVFLGLGNYIWSRLKVGKKTVKTESEKLLEEISGESETLEKLLWEKGHIQAELKEKQTQYDNLQNKDNNTLYVIVN